MCFVVYPSFHSSFSLDITITISYIQTQEAAHVHTTREGNRTPKKGKKSKRLQTERPKKSKRLQKRRLKRKERLQTWPDALKTLEMR